MSMFSVKRIVTLMALAQVGLFASQSVQANGYVVSPAARAQLCKAGENINCETQSKFQSDMIISDTTSSGFPEKNGIASGGLLKYQDLNKESKDGWAKNNIAPGTIDIHWQITSPTQFTSWRYYITKPHWQHTLTNGQLTADSFDAKPFCEFSANRTKVQQGLVEQKCQLPQRQGYQLIYAVADQADGQSLYNIIDVNIDESHSGSTALIAGSWNKELATIDNPQPVKAGDTIRVRFFSNNEQPSLQTVVKIKSGEEKNWASIVASAINSQHPDVRAGVLKNGEVTPDAQKINSIYTTSDSYLTGAVISIN
ncbi:lytic polysaccharide monooxygenase [Enterobacter bugandensis]|uniref:lytic polysaccharide monooxygenase n=1 Tax=Enterobacter bugandensis TaxID=881260 RepID=UPI002FD39301